MTLSTSLAPALAPAPAPPSDELTPEKLEAIATLARTLGPKIRQLPPTVIEDPQSARKHARFSPEDLFEFAATKFYVPETSAPIQLEPVQRVILWCMFSTSFASAVGVPSGFQRYIYSTVKKSGKTTIAALIARWITEHWGTMNEVYTVANDLDQSRGLVYDKILKSLQLDPRYDRQRDEIPGQWDIVRRDATHIPSGSVIKPLSGDYRGQAGMNPTATFWSELWGYTREESQRLWDELTPVPTRPRSIRYVETYAGFLGESLLLIDEFERGTRPDRGARQITRADLAAHGVEWPGPEVHELPLYVNPLSRQFTYWDTGVVARRMPWQTDDYYQSEAASLRQEAFDRLHLNEWVESTSTLMPTEWWDACQIGPAPEIDNQPVVVSADASVSGDCTGIIAMTRNPDVPEDTILRRAKSWTPPPGGTINYSLTIEPTLRQWITGHIHPLDEPCASHRHVEALGECTPVRPLNVVCLAYDAYQLHDLMTRFRDEGLCWTKPFSQGGDRMVADYQFYTNVRDRKIAHFGDPTVREHIGNAAAKIAKDSNTKMRLVKKTLASKIDLAVATSMANYECRRLLL